MWLRTFQTSISSNLVKLTQPKTPTRQLLRFIASASTEAENKTFDFTQTESDRILDLINNKPTENLANYNISKAKLNKIEAWKSKHGHFKHINDILTVDSFSIKIAEKFYKSLLGEEPIKKPSRKVAPFVIPSLPEAQIENIKSCVAINIGVSNVVWSRLELRNDGPCVLTHWQSHDINDKKLHLGDLIDRCLYVDFLIPQGDCYVFENPQVAQSSTPGNAEQVNINVQKAQMMAILGYALASRNTSKERSQRNVFYLKRFLAARLFQQLIGTERVSAEKTILNLMRTNYNIEDIVDCDNYPANTKTDTELFSSRGNVYFPEEHRQLYKDAERYCREFLGQTLLINMAFVRLVLLKDSKSLEIVGRNSKLSES